MGNFRYYRPGSLPWGPVGWISGVVGVATLFFICEKLENDQDAEEMARMKNRTFLYFNHHSDVAKHLDRPTFKRIQ